jgi:hypothetical protein
MTASLSFKNNAPAAVPSTRSAFSCRRRNSAATENTNRPPHDNDNNTIIHNKARRGYSILAHYHLMCTLALSLVVLCTSEALVPSSTPFLPPRGGATRSSTTTDSAGFASAATQRNFYMEDGLGDHEASNGSGSGGEYSSSGPSPVNGKVNVAKKMPPSKVRLANGAVATTTTTTTAGRMPFRNGFAKKMLGEPPMAAAAASATATRPPISASTKKNGVVLNKAIVAKDAAEFIDHPIPAEFVAETKLPTDVGQFRLRAYRTEQDPVNEFTGREPSVIYAADKSPFGDDGQMAENVPIRIHDQCLTSEVFRSQRCV